jgi:hypothetical protein
MLPRTAAIDPGSERVTPAIRRTRRAAQLIIEVSTQALAATRDQAAKLIMEIWRDGSSRIQPYQRE